MANVQLYNTEIKKIFCLSDTFQTSVDLSFIIRKGPKEYNDRRLAKALIGIKEAMDADPSQHLSIDFNTYVPGPYSPLSRWYCNRYPYPYPYPKKGTAFELDHIFYDDIATVVFWTDGTKTVVKCPNGVPFDEYTAFCAALAKKIYGGNSAVKRLIKNKARYSKKRQVAKVVCGEHSVREGTTIYPYKADSIIGKVASVNETDNGLEIEVTKND